MELQGQFPPDGNAKGSITFDRRERTFNSFGDAAPAEGQPPLPLPVIFRRIQLEKDGGTARVSGERRIRPGEDRRVYELSIQDKAVTPQLRLVLSGATGGPHRLLVAARTPTPRPNWEHLTGILELHGQPEFPDPLGDAALRFPLHLTTLASEAPDHLRLISVHGAPGGAATLDLNPNHLTFDPFGQVATSTLLARDPVKAMLRRVPTPDPRGEGRRLFEVTPQVEKLEERYFLVLSPTETGPHRLLIRREGAHRHLLPLHDGNRRYQLAMLPALGTASDPEKQAIADLRRAIGYRFYYQVKNGRVVELRVSYKGKAERIDPMLKHLPQLRRLQFRGVPLGPAGLSSLRKLDHLETLSFSGARINEAGLASLRGLSGLRSLWFSNCAGIADEGAAHLGNLKTLRLLGLSREDTLFKPELPDARVTDAGLAHLRKLATLESLDLHGQKISDHGLKQLRSLRHLKQLSLSGKGITDAGLRHLSGLGRLRELSLYGTRVTATGRKSLEARLPLLGTD